MSTSKDLKQNKNKLKQEEMNVSVISEVNEDALTVADQVVANQGEETLEAIMDRDDNVASVDEVSEEKSVKVDLNEELANHFARMLVRRANGRTLKYKLFRDVRDAGKKTWKAITWKDLTNTYQSVVWTWVLLAGKTRPEERIFVDSIPYDVSAFSAPKGKVHGVLSYSHRVGLTTVGADLRFYILRTGVTFNIPSGVEIFNPSDLNETYDDYNENQSATQWKMSPMALTKAVLTINDFGYVYDRNGVFTDLKSSANAAIGKELTALYKLSLDMVNVGKQTAIPDSVEITDWLVSDESIKAE